jgi:hypothetical protein
MAASCVTVVVTDVALGKEASPPKSFGAAAIGELAVFTELDGPEGAERLVADLVGAPDCAARLPLLVGLARRRCCRRRRRCWARRGTAASACSKG